MAQIKAASRHKSDTVVQGYIAVSGPMKRLAADGLSREPNKRVALEEPHTIVIPAPVKGQAQIINISGVTGGVIHIHNA